MTTSNFPTDTLSCPDWCDSRPCLGDHWGTAGSERWPVVTATGGIDEDLPAWERADPAYLLAAHPTWGEFDVLRPAVAIWLQGADSDETIELTPTEAREFARRLLDAAETVEAVPDVTPLQRAARIEARTSRAAQDAGS